MASAPTSSQNMSIADTAQISTSTQSVDTTSTLPPNVFTDPMYVSVFVICITAIAGIVYYTSLGNGSDTISSFDTTATSGASTGMSSWSYFFISIVIICLCVYVVYYVLETYYGYDITTKFFTGTMQSSQKST